MSIRNDNFDFVSFDETDSQMADAGKGIVRIRFDRSDDSGDKEYRRGAMVRVKVNGRSAYAILKYSQKLRKDQIAMEYDMSAPLTKGYDRGKQVPVKITKVPFWRYGHFFANHPDPIVRYAEKIGVYRSVVGFLFGLATTVMMNLIAGDEIRNLVSVLGGH